MCNRIRPSQQPQPLERASPALVDALAWVALTCTSHPDKPQPAMFIQQHPLQDLGYLSGGTGFETPAPSSQWAPPISCSIPSTLPILDPTLLLSSLEPDQAASSPLELGVVLGLPPPHVLGPVARAGLGVEVEVPRRLLYEWWHITHRVQTSTLRRDKECTVSEGRGVRGER